MTFKEALQKYIDDFNDRTEFELKKLSDIHGEQLLVISDKPLAIEYINGGGLGVLSMIDGGPLGKRYIVLKNDLEKYVSDDD